MYFDVSKTYLAKSTVVLHLTTVFYLSLLFIYPQVNIINMVFAIVYTTEAIAKLAMQTTVYWSSYYTWSFHLVDILSGPVALGLSIYYRIVDKEDLNICSILILLKITTCRMFLQLLKQLAYLFKSSMKYLRLSLSLAMCFTSMSYFLFEGTSEFFENASQSFFSMYQLSTFDGWNQQPVKDVRSKLSNYWLLYFLIYFLFMVVSYIVTNLGFFITYYSDVTLQQDFSFKNQTSISVEDLAVYFGMTQKNRKFITRGELIVIYFLFWSFMEWKIQQIKHFRVVYFAFIMFVSFALSIRRIQLYGPNRLTTSSWCVIVRGVFCPIVTVTALIAGIDIKYVMVVYLGTCVVDIFRHNELLLEVFRYQYRDIIEYLVILSSICYAFAVVIFNNKKLGEIKEMKERIGSLIEAYLFNIEIAGFDGWGDITHQILKKHPIWTWYILVLVFVCGFTIVNVFLGELLNEMTPQITGYLKEYKLKNTKVVYDSFENLVLECAKKNPHVPR